MRWILIYNQPIDFAEAKGKFMIVCVCRRISDKEISQHASEGKSFEDIQFDLGVATQCGRCEDCARDIVEQCHAKSAMAQAGWMPVAVSMRR